MQHTAKRRSYLIVQRHDSANASPLKSQRLPGVNTCFYKQFQEPRRVYLRGIHARFMRANKKGPAEASLTPSPSGGLVIINYIHIFGGIQEMKRKLVIFCKKFDTQGLPTTILTARPCLSDLWGLILKYAHL